jgi:hypothetical protein
MKLLIIGWNDFIHPLLTAKRYFEIIGYEVYFFPLLSYSKQYSGQKLFEPFMTFIKNLEINVILWWNWECDEQVINKVKENTPEIIHCLFNWDHPFCLNDWDLNLNRKILKKNVWDLVFVTGDCKLEKYLETGTKEAYYLRMFADPETHFPEKDINYECDLSLVCTNLYNDKNIFPDTLVEREKILKDLIKEGLNVKIYGPEELKKYFPNQYQGFIHFLDNHKVFYNSKINLCTHVCNGNKYLNERVGTILSSGGLLLVDHVEGINEVLKNGEDCIYLDESNYISQIKSILNNYKDFTNIKEKAVQTASNKFNPMVWCKFINEKIINFKLRNNLQFNYKFHQFFPSLQKVSIVMTYYNRISQLENTLNSIKDTLYPCDLIEVIIGDDRSIIERCQIDQSKYPFQIKLIYLDFERDSTIINPAYSYNQLFKHITGEIIILQNSECFHIGDIVSYSVNNLTINKDILLSYPCWSSANESLNQELMINRKDINKVKHIIENRWRELKDYPTEYKGWYNEKYIRPQCLHFCNSFHISTFHKVGIFNTKFEKLLGFDDNDYSERFQFNNNIKIIIPEHNFSQLVIHQFHGKYNKERPYSLFEKSLIEYNKINNHRINQHLSNKINIFREIPRIGHFFWNGNLSYLAYISILSFLKIHTNWQVYLHLLNNDNNKVQTWSNFEQKGNAVTNARYLSKLIYEFSNLKIINVNYDLLSNIGIINPNKINEVVLSDSYRYFILYNYGGFWVDSDIIFFKSLETLNKIDLENISKNKLYPDTILNKYNLSKYDDYYFAIGLLGSNKGNKLWEKMFIESKNILNSQDIKGYQKVGNELVKKVWEKNKFNISAFNLPKEEIYKLDHDRIHDIFFKDCYEEIKDKIGIHFYNGSLASKSYNNKTISGIKDDCTLTTILNKYNYLNLIIPQKIKNKIGIIIDCKGYNLHILKLVIEKISTSEYQNYDLYFLNLSNLKDLNLSENRPLNLISDITDIKKDYDYILFQSWNDYHLGDIISYINYTNFQDSFTIESFSYKHTLLEDKNDTEDIRKKYFNKIKQNTKKTNLILYKNNKNKIINIDTFVGYVNPFFVNLI